MGEPKRKKPAHHELCEGHITCPNCERDCCARPVVWGPGNVVDTVICLSCMKPVGVSEETSNG